MSFVLLEDGTSLPPFCVLPATSHEACCLVFCDDENVWKMYKTQKLHPSFGSLRYWCFERAEFIALEEHHSVTRIILVKSSDEFGQREIIDPTLLRSMDIRMKWKSEKMWLRSRVSVTMRFLANLSRFCSK